jgi:AGZA family xanthine/uracil permease-like MFS transporter
MTGATTWLGIMGFVVIGILACYGVPGGILVGVGLVTIISWPRNTPFTFFPNTPAGDAAFAYFSQVVAVPRINSTLWVLDFNFAANPNAWVALFTMLYLNIFDTTGALYAMAGFAGMLNKRGDFDGSDRAFIADALSITIGSIFGVPPCATFLESASGIAEGGRTGITALVISFCFFVALFFAPILGSIPPWASGGSLIFVGSLMASAVVDINWQYPGDSIPAFITIALMPLSYSVAYGIIGGLGVYLAINLPIDLLRWVSKGKATPDMSKREPRTNWKEMSFMQPWMKWVQCKIQGTEYIPENFDDVGDAAVQGIEDVEIGEKDVPVSGQDTNATLLKSADQQVVTPVHTQAAPASYTLAASGNFATGGPEEYPHYAEGEQHLRAYDSVNQMYSHYERAGAAGTKSNVVGL